MGTAVADSGPLRSLVLIGELEILPKLMGNVLIPPAVRAQIDRPQTPASAHACVAFPAILALVRPAPHIMDPLPAEDRLR